MKRRTRPTTTGTAETEAGGGRANRVAFSNAFKDCWRFRYLQHSSDGRRLLASVELEGLFILLDGVHDLLDSGKFP